MEQQDNVGWQAIESAFRALYGDQEPKHWGTLVSYAIGGKDPLHGISAYKAVVDGRHHWHLVTFGFTELWGKESDDPEVSGWGFELTMRLTCAAGDETPPMWILNFLQNLARYVFETGSAFDVGHHMNCNGPIAAERATKIHAFCCVPDADLPESIMTAHGAFRFVQLYGITLAELEEIVAWDTDCVARHMRGKDPQLVTDLARDDFHGDPALRTAIQQESSSAPSSTAILFVAPLGITVSGMIRKRTRLTIGANAVPSLIRLTRKRLGFAQDLRLVSRETEVVLTAGPGDPADLTPVIRLTSVDQQELGATLRQKAGVYSISAQLEIEIVRSEIKDSDGKIVSVIG